MIAVRMKCRVGCWTILQLSGLCTLIIYLCVVHLGLYSGKRSSLDSISAYLPFAGPSPIQNKNGSLGGSGHGADSNTASSNRYMAVKASLASGLDGSSGGHVQVRGPSNRSFTHVAADRKESTGQLIELKDNGTEAVTAPVIPRGALNKNTNAVNAMVKPYEPRVDPGDNMDYPELSGYRIPWLSHPDLPRAMNQTDYQNMKLLLQYIDQIFTENNITYILAYGTLLGSYITHDILPWDDDLDLMVKHSDKQKILDLLEKGTKYPHIGAMEHKSHEAKMIKIYLAKSPNAGKYPWRWPFADTCYFEEDGNHVWAKEARKISMKRDSFYPIHRRPFAGMWLPTMREPRLFLQMKYSKFHCRSHWWNHRHEKAMKRKEVNCLTMEKYYPVVHRIPQKSGVKETLRLNGSDIYTMYVDEPASGRSLTPFDFR